ncbi:aminotransferase class I/II-fold pyridoxal phosphate-dependent enzyme [Cohnella faecalis]|nr:PLP-dependent aminotransferase family protein [Cohnella faecalis]
MTTIINWMGGWPKEGLVAASEWEERLAAAASEQKSGAASPVRKESESDSELRAAIAGDLLPGSGINEGAGLLVLVSGADAAIGKLAERLLSPGDVVLTEKLTSRSVLQLLRKAGVRIVPVGGDREGMNPEALQEALSIHRPRLVYAAPSCTDPEGAAWNKERLASAIRLCRKAGVLMLRDDRQELIRYGKKDLNLRSGVREEAGVLSVGQLPPGLVGGLKFGWVAGTSEDMERWLPPQVQAELQPTSLERAALAALLREQPLSPLLDMLNVQCGRKMRRLTELLALSQVPKLTWVSPEGGIHLWLTLPPALDGEALLRGAWLKGLMFQPGTPFYATEPQRNTVRLTFAFADDRQMKAGAARLIEAMGEFLGRSM